MLQSVGYKLSGKFKLEIPTEVHCSRDRHFKLSETFNPCISDESVVLSCTSSISSFRRVRLQPTCTVNDEE